MTEIQQNSNETSEKDPLAHLHKMSTTAGLGTTDYVAVNGLAVTTLILGAASSLSLIDPILLALPVLTIVLGVMAIRQVNQSNGTQTGRGLAILGLVLSLIFAASVGGRELLEAARNRADEQAINEVIAQLDQHVTQSHFEDAYALFSGRFANRVKRQEFEDQWSGIIKSNPDPNIRSNGRMFFQSSPEGDKSAITMTLIEIYQDSPAARMEMLFRKLPDGSWKIDNVPQLFPTEEERARQQPR